MLGDNKAGQRAFSLIELSMVLVMLGLLLGTVFSGQLMLRNQRIKQIQNNAEQFHVAVTQFREKYQFFPGDKPNALSIWSTVSCVANGDGNGLIDGTEDYYVWAELVAGGFTVGNYTTCTSAQVPGVDIPSGPIESTGYAFSAGSSPAGLVTGTDGSSATFDGNYTAAIYFGKNKVPATRMMDPAISADDALQIDTIYDDASPGNGVIMTWRSYGSTTGCYDSGSGAYNAATSDQTCSLIFLNPYLRRFL